MDMGGSKRGRSAVGVDEAGEGVCRWRWGRGRGHWQLGVMGSGRVSVGGDGAREGTDGGRERWGRGGCRSVETVPGRSRPTVGGDGVGEKII